MKQQTQTTSILDNPTVLERAIIYARVSTDEQAETGTSIDNQVEKSLTYAEANNIQVVAIFKEDYTGKVLDRPELNKVREMLRSGQADNLIVYKTNRLTLCMSYSRKRAAKSIKIKISIIHKRI